jgi:hypothetical protein
MSDGPLKNLKLGSCWKRLTEAVQNGVVSATECGSLASDSLVQHLATSENCAALKDLEAYTRREQLDFDPLGSVEAIFDAHEKTPFLDTLQKELLFRMANDAPSGEAIDRALDATIKNQIGEAQNRFEEECIRARDTGRMSPEACQCALDKIDAAFNAVERQDVCDALRTGNKNTFKDAVSKKEGLDEGPHL